MSSVTVSQACCLTDKGATCGQATDISVVVYFRLEAMHILIKRPVILWELTANTKITG
jgi:hypothetical protein